MALFIKNRLRELKLDQRELAVAARVTESYISQLLTGKKPPPAPERTDIYDKLDNLLKLPGGQLAKLARLQRSDVERKERADPPAPLFSEVRQVVLRSCEPRTAPHMQAMFDRESFGPIERLVTQTLLDLVKRVARTELEDEDWLRRVAGLTDQTYEQTRVNVLEFLETTVFNLSASQCEMFLSPLIESWRLDLATFAMEVVLHRGLAPGRPRRFEFAEREPTPAADTEPGFRAFLQDAVLSRDATAEELAFLKRLTFAGRRPTAMYYYRELQSLRDPLHFSARESERERPSG